MKLIQTQEEGNECLLTDSELMVLRKANKLFMKTIQEKVMPSPAHSDLGAANYVVARQLDRDMEAMGVPDD